MSGTALDIEQLLEEAEKKSKAEDAKKARAKAREEDEKRYHQRPASRRSSDGGDHYRPRGRGPSRDPGRNRRYEGSRERRHRNGAKPDLISSPHSARDRENFRASGNYGRGDSRDRDRDRDRDRSRDRYSRDRPGYRHGRGRSRSPQGDRYYRPSSGRDRRDSSDRYRSDVPTLPSSKKDLGAAIDNEPPKPKEQQPIIDEVEEQGRPLTLYDYPVWKGPGEEEMARDLARAERSEAMSRQWKRDHPEDRDRSRSPTRRRSDQSENRYRSRSPIRRKRLDKSSDPVLNEDERDKRTVFVQQLAARCRTRDLVEFFKKAGEVKEAQIVKDRVSHRSKGVGYVEFKDEESVKPAINLTGQKLLGIPIIAALTEAEKNRQARNNSGANGNTNSAPYHRLYVGNIHFSVTEEDIGSIFEPFGELEFVQLHKDENQRSRGFGFVQFTDPENAKEALEKMNNFTLAGRAIRVGLGNDKFTPESTQTLLQKFGNPDQKFSGSSFSGSGGRGAHAGGTAGNFDRAGGRDDKKGTGASALDDNDVTAVNFNNYSRDALMKKLARAEDNIDSRGRSTVKPTVAQPVPTLKASRCLLIKGMFDPATEEGTAWIKELENDVRDECASKYGPLVHVSVDPNTQGDVYVAFENKDGGDKALKGLNGRYFDGRQLTAEPVVEAVYKTQFPKARL